MSPLPSKHFWALHWWWHLMMIVARNHLKVRQIEHPLLQLYFCCSKNRVCFIIESVGSLRGVRAGNQVVHIEILSYLLRSLYFICLKLCRSVAVIKNGIAVVPNSTQVILSSWISGILCSVLGVSLDLVDHLSDVKESFLHISCYGYLSSAEIGKYV